MEGAPTARATSWRLPGSTVERFAAAVVAAFALALIGLAAILVVRYAPGGQGDMSAYWLAAERIKHGEPLYPFLPDRGAPEVYRYAPWFAALWIPLTALPLEVVQWAWMLVLLLAAVITFAPFLRLGLPGLVLMGVFAIPNANAALAGNVQPLVNLAIIWGARRWSGPLWIALVASLKAAPLLFVLPDVRARRWRRVAVTVGLTGLLVAPMLLFGVEDYPFHAVPSPLSLWAVAPAFAFMLAVVTMAAAWYWGASRYAWLLAAIAVLTASPQAYDLYGALVLVALAGTRHESPVESRGAGARREGDGEGTARGVILARE